MEANRFQLEAATLAGSSSRLSPTLLSVELSLPDLFFLFFLRFLFLEEILSVSSESDEVPVSAKILKYNTS